MVWYILLGLVTGMIGLVSIPLSFFVGKMDEESVCKTCNKETECFARKKIFKESNVVSEFMLFSFCVVKRKCPCMTEYHLYKKHGYMYLVVNMVLTIVLFWSRGWNDVSILYGIATAAMLALSVVDWNTQYIPVEFSGIIFVCGLIRMFADFSNWADYIIGLIAVSGFLFLVNWVATPILKKKYGSEFDRVIGDGDIKLMAATGLLLGWKLNFLSLGIGCIAGSVIHLILMKIKGSDRQFALGPYLSLGAYITMMYGEQLISWYFGLMGGMSY